MRKAVCEVCGKHGVIMSGEKSYCALHYVENEPKECLFEDLRFIARGSKVGRTKSAGREILEEIKKQHPDVVKEAEKEFNVKF